MKNPYAEKFLEGFDYSRTFLRALTPERWRLAKALSTRAEILRINLRNVKEEGDLLMILKIIEDTLEEVQTLRDEKIDYTFTEFLQHFEEGTHTYALFKQVNVGFHSGTFEEALFKGLDNMMLFALKPPYPIKIPHRISTEAHNKYLEIQNRINAFKPKKRDAPAPLIKQEIKDFISFPHF